MFHALCFPPLEGQPGRSPELLLSSLSAAVLTGGYRRTGTFGLGGGGGGGGDFLARKIYAIPECVIVEIGIQTPSNWTINKIVHNYHMS